MRHLLRTLSILTILLILGAPAYSNGYHHEGGQDCQPGMNCPEGKQCDDPNCPPCPEGKECERGPGMMPTKEEMCYFMQKHGMVTPLDMAAIDYLVGIDRVAILPFVDITEEMPGKETNVNKVDRNRMFALEVSEDFMRAGYLLAPTPDSDAFLSQYLSGGRTMLPPEVANNSLYFSKLPKRALDYYVSVVPGLGSQVGYGSRTNYFLTADDVIKIASTLGVQTIVRGFVSGEEVPDRNINAIKKAFNDLLGRDAEINVLSITYHVYCGETGMMIWNGTVKVRNKANFPLFNSPYWRMAIDGTNKTADRGFGKGYFGWRDMVGAHPWWGGDMCEPGFGWCGEGKPAHVQKPDWVNPYRMGWHEEYKRGGLFLPEENNGPTYMFNGVFKRYQHGRNAY